MLSIEPLILLLYYSSEFHRCKMLNRLHHRTPSEAYECGLFNVVGGILIYVPTYILCIDGHAEF